MTVVKENQVYKTQLEFFVDRKVITAFEFLYFGQHSITSGNTFQGVTCNMVNVWDYMLTVTAEMNYSQTPAEWFNKYVGGDKNKMIHNCINNGSPSVPARPQVLDYAFTGSLIIDGESFNVCIGYCFEPNTVLRAWYLCSDSLQAGANGLTGVLTSGSSQYLLTANGSAAFNIA